MHILYTNAYSIQTFTTALLMIHNQKCFKIFEVAADWHDLMVLQQIHQSVWPVNVPTTDPTVSAVQYAASKQSHEAYIPQPTQGKLLHFQKNWSIASVNRLLCQTDSTGSVHHDVNHLKERHVIDSQWQQ